MCRQVNAEQTQARERAVDGYRVFARQYMQIDLQAGGVRELDVRSRALQELHNQLRGLFQATAEKLALRAFEGQAECQLVLTPPVPLIQQRDARRKIRARRRIGRRRLRLSPGTQVDRRDLRFLVPVDQQSRRPD